MKALVAESTFLSSSEVEAVTSLCFRALDNSNYDVRCAIAKLLGSLLFAAHSSKSNTGGQDLF